MLFGIALVALALVAMFVFCLKKFPGETMAAEAHLSEVDPLSIVNEDELDTPCRELEELGFTRLKTWSYNGGPMGPHAPQTRVVHFLGPDARTEARVSVTRIVSEKTAVRSVLCALQSFDSDGRALITGNSRQSARYLKVDNPLILGKTLRGASARTLVHAHAERIRETGFVAVSLDPAKFAEREERTSRVVKAAWEAHGLIERRGDVFVKTRWLAARIFFYGVLSPVGMEPLPSRAFAIFVALASIGVAAAIPVARLDDRYAALVAATGLFAALAAASTCAFRLPTTTGYLLVPAALTFHLLGVTSPVPWFAALLVVAFLNTALQQRKVARETVLQESANATSSKPSEGAAHP